VGVQGGKKKKPRQPSPSRGPPQMDRRPLLTKGTGKKGIQANVKVKEGGGTRWGKNPLLPLGLRDRPGSGKKEGQMVGGTSGGRGGTTPVNRRDKGGRLTEKDLGEGYKKKKRMGRPYALGNCDRTASPWGESGESRDGEEAVTSRVRDVAMDEPLPVTTGKGETILGEENRNDLGHGGACREGRKKKDGGVRGYWGPSSRSGQSGTVKKGSSAKNGHELLDKRVQGRKTERMATGIKTTSPTGAPVVRFKQ